MPFACPGCGATIARDPGPWPRRCPSCRAVVRAREADAAPPGERAFEVEVAGRPETRRRVVVPWTDRDAARLRAWLVWATVLTLGLVVALFVLARWG